MSAIASVRVPGLDARAQVWRDPQGIPHARAESSYDAFVAQGFVHAQDRLFQMDYDRRRAYGRWAELAGAGAVAQDVQMRRFRLAASARADYAALDAETRAMVDAYARGVNAFIATMSEPPMEYGLLGTRPERWDPWDACAVFKVRHVLMGTWQLKVWRGRLLRHLGAEMTARLCPGTQPNPMLIIPPGVEYDDGVTDGFAALQSCEAALTAGTEVVQVRGESLSGNGFWTKTAMAAFALQGLTIPRGRDRLGLSVRLRGPGLVMRRAIADRFPFRRARASEDLYLSLDLCLAGILPRHVDSARVVFRNAQTQQSASDQRIRWETGRMLAAREFVPRLLRRPTPARLEAAAHLLTPPVSMSMLSLATGAALAAACGWVLLVIGIGAVAIMLSTAVVTALVQVRASASTWLALAAAPVYVAWKSVVQVRAIAVVLRGRRDLAVHPTNGR